MSFHNCRSICGVWGADTSSVSSKERLELLSIESIIICSVISKTVKKLHMQKELEVVFVLEEKRSSLF